MSFLGSVLLLTVAVSCSAAPASDDSCSRPERLTEAELQGDWDNDSYPHGTEATYQCRPGYSRLGTIKRACLKGKWTITSNGQCRKKSCGHPGEIQFGSFHLTKEESFVFGAVVEYYCDDGYQMVSKERIRQCTASGWTYYPPHCEVRNCPAIEAADNVIVLSTSFDEEYSVGQVVKFECKDPNLKLNGASEIFCTSEGEWNTATPACVGISCQLPQVDNGRVNTRKAVFKNSEIIQITCNEGFITTKNGESTCTKDDWIPTPHCKEIVCSAYQHVEKGRIISTQAVYRYGDEIVVECERGYVLQTEPDKLRKCTSNGWSPPIRCVSKKCDKPDISHGYPERHYYPLDKGRYVYYQCDRNYLTPRRSYYEYIYCTEAGWDPEPRCLRKCSRDDASLENARFIDRDSVYLEGDTAKIRCDGNYKTPDGKSDGEIMCLPNGQFTAAKCSLKCKAPQIQNGKLHPIKIEFEVGEHLQYECNKGYMTRIRKLIGSTQCVDGGWSETPSCVAITCRHKNKEFKDRDIVKYTCPRGQKPTSDAAQCYYFGFGPPAQCQDIECTIPGTLNLILSPHKSSYKYRNTVSFSCNEGFDRVGPLESDCTEEGWNPPLPTCQATSAGVNPDEKDEAEPTKPGIPDLLPDDNEKQEKKQKCPPAYSPINVEILDPKEAYYSNDNVTMQCSRGYKMHGSSIIRCVEGIWEQPPECIRLTPCKNPSAIKNGNILESSKQEIYVTDDAVTYTCKSGFHISGSDQSTCLNGQWSTSPKCIEDSCDEAPEVPHATVVEKRKLFSHGERARYTCEGGFRFSREDSASCVEGKWLNIPTCVATSCESPPTVPNAVIIGRPKASYASGEKVTYSCKQGYSLERSLTGEALCENTQWHEVPVCRKIGAQCGPPPTVQFGDTVKIRKASYMSGESVEYRCPNYYILKGENIVQCYNGVWNEAPVCLEPCTASEKDMEDNNIQLRHRGDKKLYSEHGDVIEFMCKDRYEALPDTKMRVNCLQGKLQYPKCFRQGYCVLLQGVMITNNINYNTSNVVDPGQTITFQCNEGMMPENKLDVKCERGIINYPKCVSAKSCKTPNIRNGLLKTEQQDSYDSGSSVVFECKENYVINGPINVKCENGQWTDLPVCQSPCKISSEELIKRNIQLLSDDQKPSLDRSYVHATEFGVTCKSGYKRPNQAALVIECYDGKFRYPRCFSGKTCRINQDDLDQNNIELDEVHDNEVFYEEDEKILFKCKNGFHHLGQPTGTCSDQALSYPQCTASSSV